MFHSTRGNQSTTASKAIVQGLAKDKGLFVFDTVENTFFSNTFTTYTYTELAKAVLAYLLDDYSQEEIAHVVESSYNSSNFTPSEVTFYLQDTFGYMELFNGNTFAFKDMALSMLPHLFDTGKQINEIHKKTIILTATSGDTGSAALNGFSQLDDTYVIVLYPKDGVSPFQELQMNSYQSDTCIILGVDGNFDDCQRIVKEVFYDCKPDNVLLSSANSINIGRIIPQIIYYIYSYLELVRQDKISFGEPINVTVPTGNFGNIYAAYVAKKMGVPFHKLIIASNENNVLTKLFNEGIYDQSMALKQTYSPSMDILTSSNLERYLYDLYDKNTDFINDAFSKIGKRQSLFFDRILQQDTFIAQYCNEKETISEIKRVFEEYDYVIDPHTAVASHVASTYKKESKDDLYMLVVSTASPYKFSDVICEALDITVKDSVEETFDMIEQKTKKQVDPRMKRILNQKSRKRIISLEGTFDYIKQLVGEINAKD
jgi:threonine synthase